MKDRRQLKLKVLWIAVFGVALFIFGMFVGDIEIIAVSTWVLVFDILVLEINRIMA